jgi:hypothetical protein
MKGYEAKAELTISRNPSHLQERECDERRFY